MMIQNLSKKQLKIVDKMDHFIYTYRNNVKEDPPRIALFKEDFKTLGLEMYKGIKVESV